MNHAPRSAALCLTTATLLLCAHVRAAVAATTPTARSETRAVQAFERTARFDPVAAFEPGAAGTSSASASAPPQREPAWYPPTFHSVLSDVKHYYTAPLRWNTRDWELFAGTLGAIALAHHFDGQVRAHFVHGSGIGGSTNDLGDAMPAVALFLGTYIYSSESHSTPGLKVTWGMTEAAGLATVTAFALKYVAGRARPNATTDPNHWRAGGSSFPSVHAAAAFALGTVFAESGEGRYRWVTRILGYGVAGFTAYQRLHHNAHWLSDVVAGAALGASTAMFVLHRNYGSHIFSALSVVPENGGLMLAYQRTLP